ncbi:MAG: DUF1501 domain-containing protein [Planctomycetaceae bacterium]|nr:DUF1501 domain-containing protein [Planctomycetaceae bacterium]
MNEFRRSLSRRDALCSLGAGFGGLALADLLRADSAGAPTAPHFAPRAKSVIFLFMSGGPSHLDLFDPKPEIAKRAGQRPQDVDVRTERVTGGLLPSPFQFRKCGAAGIEVSELLPEFQACVDDVCVVRSLHGVNPNHAPAANHLFSGRIDQIHPSLGAWVSYGLGRENDSLPGFVSIKNGDTASRYVRNGYLPGENQATPIDPRTPRVEKMIRHLRNEALPPASQRRQLEFIRALNAAHRERRPGDDALDARVQAMETAFQMQFAAGEALDLATETKETRRLYGTGWFADGCLVARRLVERGVRYIHLEVGNWDHHDKIGTNIRKSAAEIDRPLRALLVDLKRRGLLADTLVVWSGEFGRTPVSENGDGRDHNPFGFTAWLAGGGVRGGFTYGATDDFGFKAVENRVGVHDLHATMLHLLGLDHERLTYRHSGRDFRLTDVHGRVVREILA